MMHAQAPVRRRQPTLASGKPRVLLLHGLWMHAPALRWFATRLRSRGFDARTLGYYSVMEDTEHACRASPRPCMRRPAAMSLRTAWVG